MKCCTKNTSGKFTIKAEDSPMMLLGLSGTRAEIAMDFRMFLMWRPKGASDTQRIPLAKLEWGWKAIVENKGNPGWNNWTIVGQSWYPSPVGYGQPTSEKPVLSPVLCSDFDRCFH